MSTTIIALVLSLVISVINPMGIGVGCKDDHVAVSQGDEVVLIHPPSVADPSTVEVPPLTSDTPPIKR